MKKVFILIFILSGLLIESKINANYRDYFRVFYKGTELSPGDTIYCTDYNEIETPNRVIYNYETAVNVVNQLSISNINWAQIEYGDTPTEEEADSDKKYWGNLALCYYGGDENGEMASCMSPSGSAVRIPNNEYDCFEWHPQLQKASPECRSVYKLVIKAGFGELAWWNYYLAEDSEFYVTIVFQPKETSSINTFEKEDQPEVYYDLRGNVIKNPGRGLYIVKRGNTYSKEYIIK